MIVILEGKIGRRIERERDRGELKLRDQERGTEWKRENRGREREGDREA